MKKLMWVWVGLAFLVLIIGVCQASSVTPGDGVSFNVNGLYDGMTFQVDVDGYFYSNGDGTYAVSCPINLPISVKNGKLKVYLYSGTGKTNQLIVKTGDLQVSWVQDDYYFYITRDFPAAQYEIIAQGMTGYEKVNAKFVLTGKKYGPNNFLIDCNGVQGKGMAKVRVLLGGVKKYEKTHYFDSTCGEGIDIPVLTPKPTPTPMITPRPTPTPQPTKSPGQIWAERNCWWYRVT